MDLYYILMKNKIGGRRFCISLIKKGYIKVNGQTETHIKYSVKDSDIVIYNDMIINTQPFSYFMFNKPSGYISANKDSKYPCVLDFFENKDLSLLGRLDKDTTGLMILTDDKALVKKVTLPQNHCLKKYHVVVKKPLSLDDVIQFKNGVIIDRDIKCENALMEIIDDTSCYVTIYTGKYHQIKKMFLSICNEVVSLKRVSISGIELDETLKLGEYRALTKEEIELLKNDKRS